MMKFVTDIGVEDGQKISIKEIKDIFMLNGGFELSEIQSKQIYSEMGNGRAFNRHRFQNWIFKNC